MSSQTVESKDLLHSPLEDFHHAHGAKMVPFAGWLMPLSYGSERFEHLAVRNQAGLFDLSHMGVIIVEGPQALRWLNHHLVSDIDKVKIGKAKYTLCCSDTGTILEDLVVYRIDTDQYLLIVNASNTNFMLERLGGFHGSDAKIDNVSKQYSLVAVQGPKSVGIVSKITDLNPDDLGYYSIAQAKIEGRKSFIARTGYTGEDGFEILFPAAEAEVLADLLLEAGKGYEMELCGLGSRDSLRLEAGMALYGNELTPETNPFEAGLSRLVDFSKKEDFVGKTALLGSKDAAVTKRLVGIEIGSKRPARHGYKVVMPKILAQKNLFSAQSSNISDSKGRTAEQATGENGFEVIGEVTSGTASPSLNKSIAMAYLDSNFSMSGQEVYLEMRNNIESGKIVDLPFYKRNKV